MTRTDRILISGVFAVLITATLAGLIMVQLRSDSVVSGAPPKGGSLPSILERLSDDTGERGRAVASGEHGDPGREAQGEQPLLPEFHNHHLVLKGTIAGGNTMKYAIVVDSRDDRQYLLKTGDTVKGAIVKRIERNKVDLLARGRLITLKVSRASSEGSTEPYQDDGTKPPYTREELMQRYDSYGERAAEVETLRKQIVMHPNETGVLPSGVLVVQVESASIFDTMGLKKGDIITSVDGKCIETLDDSMELFECLGTNREGSLSITRDGQPAVLTYRNDAN